MPAPPCPLTLRLLRMGVGEHAVASTPFTENTTLSTTMSDRRTVPARRTTGSAGDRRRRERPTRRSAIGPRHRGDRRQRVRHDGHREPAAQNLLHDVVRRARRVDEQGLGGLDLGDDRPGQPDLAGSVLLVDDCRRALCVGARFRQQGAAVGAPRVTFGVEDAKVAPRRRRRHGELLDEGCRRSCCLAPGGTRVCGDGAPPGEVNAVVASLRCTVCARLGRWADAPDGPGSEPGARGRTWSSVVRW